MIVRTSCCYRTQGYFYCDSTAQVVEFGVVPMASKAAAAILLTIILLFTTTTTTIPPPFIFKSLVSAYTIPRTYIQYDNAFSAPFLVRPPHISQQRRRQHARHSQQQQQQQHTSPFRLFMMNSNNDDSLGIDKTDENESIPFFVASTLSPNGSTSNTKVNDTVGMTVSTADSSSPSSLVTPTQPLRPIITTASKRVTSTSTSSSDPVLAVADSFVDVFTSVGKLFSNLFNPNNNNNNQNSIPTTNNNNFVDTSTNTIMETTEEMVIRIQRDVEIELAKAVAKSAAAKAAAEASAASTIVETTEEMVIRIQRAVEIELARAVAKSAATTTTEAELSATVAAAAPPPIVQVHQSGETMTKPIDTNDDTTTFMSDIVTSILETEQQQEVVIVQPENHQQRQVASETFDSTTATEISSIDDGDDVDDVDPFHMTSNDVDDIDSLLMEYTDNDDIVVDDNPDVLDKKIDANDTTNVETLSSSSEIEERNASIENDDVMIQEVNGWTTTTTIRDGDNNDDDYVVVVEYDIDELDRWNRPEPTTDDLTVQKSSGTDNAIELEAMTMTITPSTDDDDYDTDEDDENNDTMSIVSELSFTDKFGSELQIESMDGSTSTIQLDELVTEISPTYDETAVTIAPTEEVNNVVDDNSLMLNDVEQVDARTESSTVLDLDTNIVSDTSNTMITLEEDTASLTNSFASNDTGNFQITENTGDDDVVMVFDTDELDSWNIGKNDNDDDESKSIQLESMELTITECTDDNEDDFNEDLESSQTSDIIESIDNIVITSATSAALDDDEEEAEDDIFSDEDWDASIQLAQQSMGDDVSGMTINFDDAPSLVVDDYGGIDTVEWESAEQLTKSLNEVPDNQSDMNIDNNDIDMEALAKAARNAVEIFEQQYENERQETQRQRDRWKTEQHSTSSEKPTITEDVDIPQLSTDLSAAWNKMTMSELKGELESRGLAKAGSKAKLISRLMENETSAATEGMRSLQPDKSNADKVLPDWSIQKVADLRVELSRRGLPTAGKKAELVAALRESDLTIPISITTISGIRAPVVSSQTTDDEEIVLNKDVNTDEDIEKIAKAAREAVANFEQATGNIRDEAEFDGTDETVSEFFDDDIDFHLDDIDIEALGKAARDAVLQMQVDDDEPSDEALWEIENEIALAEEPFVIPPNDSRSTNDDPDVEKLKMQQRSDPLPDYVIMAVSQLKEELNRRGLRVTGKKIDLIARLEASDKEILK